MTRKGRRRAASRADGWERYHKAVRDHESVEMLLYVKQDDDERANDAAQLIIQAAIAYNDAVTALYGGEIAKGSHTECVKVLRDALGNALPQNQETRLRRLLGSKEGVEYGAHRMTAARARELQHDLDRFATWVSQVLETDGQ